MNEQAFTLRDHATQTDNDRLYRDSLSDYFASSKGDNLAKLENFSRFVPRQVLALFLAKNMLFEKILTVHGSIVECGVFMGGGLFTWAQLSAIYEPINHNRKIIGFDSFDGFPSVADNDLGIETQSEFAQKKIGGYRFDGLDELCEGVRLYDLNRSVGHIHKVELIKGDAVQTIPDYLNKNPHTVVSLLYLDFDLFEPTVAALRTFLPRIPSGGIIAFDELNQVKWPGETLAVLEEVGIRNLAIRRFPFTPALSYAVVL